MTTSTPVSTEHIDIDPAICGGRPRIKGTRIRVQDIVTEHFFQGLGPEEIVSAFPHLTLADVHAALANYFDHIDEIRQRMRQDQEYADKMRALHPSLLKLRGE